MRGLSLGVSGGFSLKWLLLLQASVLWYLGLVALRHVDLPGPGTEPVFLAWQGGFLSAGPLGKHPFYSLKGKGTREEAL